MSAPPNQAPRVPPEANAPGLRDQTARLRAIFRGIDSQVGLFGALGRKSHGRPAPEVVIDSYRGGIDALEPRLRGSLVLILAQFLRVTRIPSLGGLG